MNQYAEHKTILIAGHICLDIIPDLSMGKSLGELEPGKLSIIGAAQTATGGVVSNTGLALHILGQKVKLCAKLGDDEFGALVQKKFEAIEAGLGSGFILDGSTNTSYSLVMSPEGQDRHFLHHPGANDTLLSGDIPDTIFEGVSLMHFGYPPLLAAMVADEGEELSTLLERSKSAGLVNSLDMAGVDPESPVGKINWLSVLERTLPAVDIFMPSLDEVAFMLGESAQIEQPKLDELQRISQKLLDYGAGMVGLKLGEYGIYFRTSSKLERLKYLEGLDQAPSQWCGIELMQPCFQVEVQGTTGAGDCSIAGFLAGLCRGLSAEECLQMAAGVGACNVEAQDAISGLLSWDETQFRINDGWSLSPKRVLGVE